MPFAAATSEHPLATHAGGEVVGQVLEALGEEPDLAIMFVTPPFAGVLDDLTGVVRHALKPRVLVAVAAEGVVGGGREIERTPAVALWAARLAAPPIPVRLQTVTREGRTSITGLPRQAGGGPRTLVLTADPFTFPASAFLDHARGDLPQLVVSGGMASAAEGPGGNRLVLDDRTWTDGAVGFLLPPGAVTTPVVSQGCRPIGEPMIVTRAEGNVVYELAGRPAIERLAGVVAALPPEDRELAARGVQIGLVVDERKASFGRGDFLIRSVVGGDRAAGALAVGDRFAVGATVQFQVRDAASADEDLRALMAGRAADGALVFTCNGRGSRMFGRAGHDAEVVEGSVRDRAVAGMSCAGELGPVGDRSFVHGFTASVVLFED